MSHEILGKSLVISVLLEKLKWLPGAFGNAANWAPDNSSSESKFTGTNIPANSFVPLKERE